VTTPQDADPVAAPHERLRRATPLVFLGLSAPTLAQLQFGDLSLDQAALRCLVALLVAVVGVQLLTGLVRGYATPPEPVEPVEEAAQEPPPARRAEDTARAA
jgi:hypothetical protein